MTTEEFIAWFDGFTRRNKGRPSNKDWSEIITAIGRIDGSSPLKAWFEGLLVKVKSAPSENEWAEIRRKVSEAQPKTPKQRPGVNESFKSFSKKPAKETPSAGARSYPGSKPFGKK
ncbi:MAG: hypothetical protein WAW96_18770 [Alphaproteobacteria bacterium]